MRQMLLFFLLTPFLLRAQSSGPMLMLNTTNHSGVINRIDCDARGRYLITASRDKTAKIWDLNSGNLIRTLRPPIDQGDDGMLYAGALSPDGRFAAVGGWSKDNDVYVFDVASGRLLKRITNLPNVINDLEYSPDGRYLAAVLGGSNGLYVWRASDYSLQAKDNDYDARTYNLAFDAWGRLATVCYDGYIRVYQSNFSLEKKARTTAGKRPFSLDFSPDGRKIAVGYNDSPTIQVLDASTLSVLYAPDITGASTLDDRVEMVAFSSDGSSLAAGYANDIKIGSQYWRQIRVWTQAGKGAYTDHPAGLDGISDIKALPNGNFLYSSYQPDWGIIDPVAKNRSLYVGPETSSFRATDRSHFRLGAGGNEIGITPFGFSPVSFSLKGRRLSQTSSNQPASVSSRNGITVTSWDTGVPAINNKTVGFFKEFEDCQSVDIANGGQGIVLGTNWNIRCTDASGAQKWENSIQSTAWCVNIDEYNLVVGVAHGDGTIRWYRISDGKHLLSLYLHPDNQRWVLWTPSGYYDAAPGAEDLIGWHVNNGPDKAADYFPASRFRDTYYRPDVIDLVLETLDETEALRQANLNRPSSGTATRRAVTEELPPVVRITSPVSGAEVGNTQVSLEYTVESANGEPVTGVRVQIDGRPISRERGLRPGARQQVTVTIPAADCAVSIIAENRFGASEAATVRLRWAGAKPAAPTTTGIDIRPRLYVLAIGVSNYSHSDVNDLDFAAKDASDFAAVVKKQGGPGQLYQNVEVKLLLDPQATKDNILDGLEWLQRQTTSRDVAMLFFAGHGIDDNSGNFFFLPVGADPNSLRRTGLLHADVQSTVASIAGKIVVFMDACHSGSLMRSIARRDLPPDIGGIVNELVAAENGAVVFSSATTRQYALEDPAWNNGAFTKALVEGLSGKARTGSDGKITTKTLDAYLSERVKALTRGAQSPTTVWPPNVPDFPIAIFR